MAIREVLAGGLFLACLSLACPGQASAQTPAQNKPAPALEFTDDPHFAVAGITDWTAVGGHGSDNVLRTSEELARISAAPSGTASVAALQAQAEAARRGGHLAEAHRLQGQADELAGDPLRAVREDAAAAALNPSEQNLLQWGSELLLHRAVLQAGQVFADGVRRFADSVPLRTGLGSALFAQAHYAQAQDELCRAAALAPSEAGVHRALAQVALESPAAQSCVQPEMQRWLAQQPNNAEALCLEGQLQARVPEAAQAAETTLRRAVTLDPKLAQAWLALGVLAAEAHRNEEAGRDLRAAIAADPALPEPHFRLAVLLRANGQTAEAKTEFARHAQLQAEDAARVEREREAVKEFVIAAGK